MDLRGDTGRITGVVDYQEVMQMSISGKGMEVVGLMSGVDY